MWRYNVLRLHLVLSTNVLFMCMLSNNNNNKTLPAVRKNVSVQSTKIIIQLTISPRLRDKLSMIPTIQRNKCYQ